MNSSKFKLWGTYIVIVFIVQETIFSFCFPLAEVTNINRSLYTPVPNNVLPWKPIRYETLTYTSAPDSFYTSYHRLNQYGFRDNDWTVEKPKNKQRVLFVGDSFVEGAMSTFEQSIPKSFEKTAHNEGVEVMNAGISGAGLPEYASIIHDLVPTFQPDVLILVLFANDVGIREAKISPIQFVPEHPMPYLPRIFHIIQRLAKGESAGFRWGADRPLNPPVPDPANHWSIMYDEYAPHVDSTIVQHMQDGNFNIWRINYLKFEEIGLKRHVDLSPFLKQVQDYTNSFGTELLVCYVPSRNQVTNYYIPFDRLSCKILCDDSINLTRPEYQAHRISLDSLCKQRNIPFLDLTTFITKKEEANEHMYWKYDDHFLPSTYERVGELIYGFWKVN